ncbi:MAG: peptidoglycan DD-metalloendopeptidase family protein [Rikenellaceae bacterium]
MLRRLATLLALIIITAATPTMAQQKSVDAQKRVIAAIEKLINDAEKSIASIKKDRSAAQSRVQSLARQVEQRNRLLEEQQTQIDLLNRDIDSVSLQLLSLNEQLEEQREEYSEMVRDAYRNYRQNNFVSYIFASENFKDVARRIVNVRRLAQLREQRMASIDSLAQGLDSTRLLLLDRKASLDSVAQGITLQRTNIQKDINSARTSISSMSSKERTALQTKALQEQKLDAAIDELRKLSKGNTQGASFSTRTSNLNLPVEGGRVKRYMDNMAEVVGSSTSNVISIYEGKVVDVKQNRITGRYDIYIAHGEYIASYAGLKNSYVVKGDGVKKNQTIGKVGAAIDVTTMNTEHKIIFGIYPPSPNQKMKASDCFKR